MSHEVAIILLEIDRCKRYITLMLFRHFTKYVARPISITVICLMIGCSTSGHRASKTLGEEESGFTYVPIDPFSVALDPASADCPNKTNLLEALPDNAVRIAVEQIDSSGTVTYGPAGLSVKGGRYRLVIDYITADTVNVPMIVTKSVRVRPKARVPDQMSIDRYEAEIEKWNDRMRDAAGTHLPPDILEHDGRDLIDDEGNRLVFLSATQPLPNAIVPNSTWYTVVRYDKFKSDSAWLKIKRARDKSTELNIPVYVGIGLRVTAEVKTHEANINLSGLPAIAAAAEAKKLTGTLVVQTLGANGKSVLAALPFQTGELNATTIQHAVASVGAIKALLYEPGSIITPRVVGLYLPVRGDKALINAIVSELSSKAVVWKPGLLNAGLMKPVTTNSLISATVSANQVAPVLKEPGK